MDAVTRTVERRVMKIVIEIPEEKYQWIKEHRGRTDYQTTEMLYKRIRNGVPLPKGHGRLKDEKEIYKKFYCRCLAGVAEEVLRETSTIIEADEGESEE